MRCFLISDSVDTRLGMGLAGVYGVVARERDEALSALETAMADETVAIVLMTKKLTELCAAEIHAYKLETKRPLIVEIPDRYGDSHISETITGYVSEAIGVKL
ncbi:MAG: V-type ATP synthase subunit F [Bacteroides sp.]|nr:V-type ATP synthase subunit F [Eubacterium sp.]MCM1419155.1 V-type ATP synthase subunit F [Roseburia sp.]MCM1463052.1 V-type ATP synthase subunit F [Bacteroides sp.]